MIYSPAAEIMLFYVLFGVGCIAMFGLVMYFGARRVGVKQVAIMMVWPMVLSVGAVLCWIAHRAGYLSYQIGEHEDSLAAEVLLHYLLMAGFLAAMSVVALGVSQVIIFYVLKRPVPKSPQGRKEGTE